MSQVRNVRLIVIGLILCLGPVDLRGEGPNPPRRLVLINADLKLGKPLPHGWSHLLVRSIPRLQSGDLGSLPGFAKESATLFHSLILADVRQAPGESSGFRLVRVGLALCVPVAGVDTVVRAEGPCAARDALSFLDRQVVPIVETETLRARIIAATPTMIVFSAPAMCIIGGTHKEALLHYAVAVDAKSGELSTFFWIRPTPGTDVPTGPFDASPLRLVPPALNFDCPLDVHATRILGTLPVGWTFAMTKLPDGRKLAADADLDSLRADPARIKERPEVFENLLRRTALAAKPSDAKTVR